MQKGTIVYLYGQSLYINLTNRCPNSCEFCIRNFTDNLGDADNLWLEKEPTVEEVIFRIKEELDEKKAKVDEIIFCGYGEPTERLKEVLEISRELRQFTDRHIRINTNGLSDLINQKETAPLFEGIIDAVSVSLNAPTAEKYDKLCHPKFGVKSYDAILKWTKDIKKYVPDVRMSVVGVISEEDIEQSRKRAEELGVKFRVR